MPIRFEKILCAVAIGEFTERIISYAASLAKRYSCILYLVTVVEEPRWLSGIDEDVDALFSTFEERDRLALRDWALKVEELSKSQVEPVVLRGKAADEILKFATDKGVDLIVIGSHTVPPAIKVLLGSTAQKIINASSIPVLVVPIR